MKKNLIIVVSLLALAAFVIFLYRISDENAGNPLLGKQEGAVLGPESAKVTLTEYSDLQCPACASYAPIIKQLSSDFPDDLKIVYVHFPLVSIHKNTLPAAYAAEAAGKQGKFWDMINILFSRQSEWERLSDPRPSFQSYAQTLGLNADQFITDSSSDEAKNTVAAQLKSAEDLGLSSTPTFYLNEEKLSNPGSYEEFKKLIEEAIAKARAEQAPSTN